MSNYFTRSALLSAENKSMHTKYAYHHLLTNITEWNERNNAFLWHRKALKALILSWNAYNFIPRLIFFWNTKGDIKSHRIIYCMNKNVLNFLNDLQKDEMHTGDVEELLLF